MKPGIPCAPNPDRIGHDLRDVSFDAISVGIVAGSQPTFDVNLRPLLHVFIHDIRGIAPRHHMMPLRYLLYGFCLPVGVTVGRRHTQAGNLGAPVQYTNFGIRTYIPDDDDLVYHIFVVVFGEYF